MSDYYVRNGGRVIGPFPQAKVTDMKGSGRITETSELSADRVNWVKAEDVPWLYTTKYVPPPEPIPEPIIIRKPSQSADDDEADMRPVNKSGSGMSTTTECPDCGHTVSRKAASCPGCGNAIGRKIRSCSDCGADMSVNANACPHCGCAVEDGMTSAQSAETVVCDKNKTTAGILALFLGGLGIHQFYLGNAIGVVYILFIWTGIPAIFAFVEGIMFLCMSDDNWNMKYGKIVKVPAHHGGKRTNNHFKPDMINHELKRSYISNQNNESAPSNNGIGIASFAISIVCAIWFLLLCLLSSIIMNSQGQLHYSDANLIGVMVWIIIFVDFIAFLLGIIGLCQSASKKIFAVLGTIFSIITGAIIITLMFIGIAASN